MGKLNEGGRLEPWAFRLLVVLHLLPIWATRWFVTLDGPAHLYNARIVRELLLGDSFFQRFFHLSTYPEPYWTGHAAMALLLGFLPAWLVEKLLWSTAVIALACAFRQSVHTFAPTRPWASLLVMPFLLHYALRLGFLNFSLSLPLLFLALSLAWRGMQRGRLRTAPLALTLLLLYFTHLSTFLLCAGQLCAMAAWCWLTANTEERCGLRRVATGTAIALATPLALVAGYAATHQPAGASVARLPAVELLRWIVQGRSWNALGTAGEGWVCTLTALPLLAAGLAAMYLRARQGRKGPWRRTDFWPLITLATLAAYFVLPDVVAGGSSVSPRLLLFSMFFLACTIAVSDLPLRATGLAVLLVVITDLGHTRIQYTSSVSLGRECAELMAVQPSLADHTVLLPLNYSGNWMHSNLSNYLGTGKARVLVLDHFTALAPFNPAQWNARMLPYAAVGNFATSNQPCIRLTGYRDSTGVAIDAVLAWKLDTAVQDSCVMDARAQLQAGYRFAARSPSHDAQLFLPH